MTATGTQFLLGYNENQQTMETTHRIVSGDARELEAIDDASVELVVTSPPYPMIELWDDLFTQLNPTVGEHLAAGDGHKAHAAMHAALEPVWDELARVVVDGGVVCINVGDATRSLDGQFRLYHNHAKIIEALETRGFVSLPTIRWRKPTNSTAKFLGSGMVPPNAYPTLEHEQILIFRKGHTKRSFEPNATHRYEAAYFWEERNRWFSDLWTEITGTGQTAIDETTRDRSAAYPFSIPYRLVNMYSVYGDTVLDPFWGTGTTSLAAAVAARNSIGYELDSGFIEAFDQRMEQVASLAAESVRTRLRAHRNFASDNDLEYEATHYEFPVRTQQEQDIRFYVIDTVTETANGYRVTHRPAETVLSGPSE